MVCYPLGKMKALTYAQAQQYNKAATIFTSVQAYNSAIVALRAQGYTQASYYKFPSTEELTLFILGQQIFVQNDPDGAAAGLYNTVLQI
jgi:hypothetical protein